MRRYWFGPLWQVGIWNAHGLAAAGPGAIQDQSRFKLRQCLIRDQPFHLDQISFWQVVHRVGQSVRQLAVIRQDEKPLARQVQAASGIDTREGNILLQGIPPFIIGKSRGDAERLIKGEGVAICHEIIVPIAKKNKEAVYNLINNN